VTPVDFFKWLNVLLGNLKTALSDSSRVQVCEVRPALPRRGPVSLQSARRYGRHGAAASGRSGTDEAVSEKDGLWKG